jgi:hypothetical protein
MSMADVKPQTSPGPQTTKGAQVNPVMGEPLTPTGPNETEDGIIKAPPPEPPGEDQIGLIGGDPGEPLQSTPPHESVDNPVGNPSAKGAHPAAKAKAVADR